MTGAEFEAAGLAKLDDAELQALNSWIRSQVASGPQAGDASSQRDGFGLVRTRPLAGGEVVDQIDGRFTGWDGNTTFRLANGQVWRQVEGGNLAGVDLDSPTVTIKSGLFGAFYLGVEGYNKKVKVERVR